MRKQLALLLVVSIIIGMYPAVALAAATTLNLSTNNAVAGERVTVAGEANANTWVSIKVLGTGGSVPFFGGVKTSTDGNYTGSFKVPSTVTPGDTLKVVAGCGNNVATAILSVNDASLSGGGSSNNDKDDTTSTSKENTTTLIETTINGNEIITTTIEEALNQETSRAEIEIQIDEHKEVKTVTTSIPRDAMNTIRQNGVNQLTVSNPLASLIFDQDAISTIAGEADENIKITTAVVENDTLSEKIRQKVGNRPVYELSVESGDRSILQFNGNVTVSKPYTLKPGEDPNAIVIYYINAEGELEIVSNCTYNLETGTVSFKTNHFSQYAVGYNKVTFNDVAENAWYSKAVTFIAARDITSGTGNGNYSPKAKLTRGQFIVLVMRAYGINPDETFADNFADAGDSYYTSYLATAKRLKISKGIGNNLFAPEKEITRQEMFTLLYNVLEKINSLPVVKSEKEISEFSDSDEIAPWAMDAMSIFVKTEIIRGSNNMLYPASTANRAEMAQIMYNLLSK